MFRLRSYLLLYISTLFLVGCTNGGTQPPPDLAVSISNPGTDVLVNGSLTVQVVVTGGSAESVQLLKDGQVLVELSKPYTYTWDTSSESEGEHTLIARAKAKDVSADSPARKVVIDRTPPSVTEQTPAPNARYVWVKDDIQISFSEPLMPSSLTNTSVSIQAGGIAINKEVEWADSNYSSLKIRLKGPVQPPLTLTASVGGLKDRAGNLIPVTSWSWELPLWYQVGGPKAILDTDPNQHAYNPILRLDSGGNPVVGFWEYPPTERIVPIAYIVKRWNGKAWIQLGDAPAVERSLGETNLLLGPGDQPWVVWSGYVGACGIRHWDGSQWAGGEDVSYQICATHKRDAMILDAQGHPILPVTADDGLYIQRWENSSWSNFINSPLDEGNSKPTSIKLAFDALGRLNAAFITSRTVGDVVAYTIQIDFWDNTLNQWRTRASIGRTQPPTLHSLVFDTTNHPMVMWTEAGGIYLALGPKSGDSIVPVVFLGNPINNTGKIVGSPSMVLDVSGNPIVSWAESDDYINDGTAYIKRWNGSAWTQLDAFPTIPGRVISLATDAEGNLTLAHSVRGSAKTLDLLVKRYNVLP